MSVKAPPKLNVVSSDSHVVEPPDLWQRHIEPKYRDRAPHLKRGEKGDVYWCDGGVTLVDVALLSSGGKNPEEIDLDTARYDRDVRKGGYDPKARLADMAMDGIDAEVLYPTLGLRMYEIQDLGYRKACFEAYNRWLAEEYVKGHRDIFRGVAMVTLDDIPWSVEEARKAKKAGLDGLMISVTSHDRRYESTVFDPVWAVAEELEMPVTMHLATMRSKMVLETPPDTIEMCLEAAWTLGTLIFSGVFLRFPKLKVISAENDAGWMAYYLWRSDFSKGGNLKRITRGRGHALSSQSLLPSEIFRRNVYMSFQRDRSAVQMRQLIGPDNLMWGADYPHLEGTWPISRQTFDWLFAGIPEADKRKMIRDNCAKLYGWEM